MAAEFDPRPWAAAQLEVRPDAPPAEFHDALRRRLADDDFVPPWAVQQAAEILLRGGETGRGQPARAQARLDEEQRLWNAIDDFAGEFFDLAPAERRQGWQALRTAGAFSPLLVARLRALEPGLNVTPPSPAAPDVAELARHACNLFVLRPAARAAHRQALLRRFQCQTNQEDSEPSWDTTAYRRDLDKRWREMQRWQTAARTLRQQAPAVAGLARDFVEHLANWDIRLREQAKAKQKAAVQLENGASNSGGPARGSYTWVFVLIGVVCGLLRAVSSGPGTSRNTPPPPMPNFDRIEMPRLNPGNMDEELRRLERLRKDLDRQEKTNPELRRFREELRRLGQDPGRTTPPPDLRDLLPPEPVVPPPLPPGDAKPPP